MFVFPIYWTHIHIYRDSPLDAGQYIYSEYNIYISYIEIDWCVSLLRPTGLNVLGYQSHLLRSMHIYYCNVAILPVITTKGSSHFSPVLAYEFLSRCKNSTLTTHQPIIVEFYSRSHAFRCGTPEKNKELWRERTHESAQTSETARRLSTITPLVRREDLL